MEELEEEPSHAGFDVPALVLTSALPCTEGFAELLQAAVDAPRISGVGAPSVLTDDELAGLEPILSADAHFVLAGPSEAVGELAVQRR